MKLRHAVLNSIRAAFGLRRAPAPAAPASPALALLHEVAALSPAAALARMDSSAAGLPAPEALARLARVGPNEVATDITVAPLKRLAELVLSPLTLLLLGLAVLTDLTGEPGGAVVIGIMVLLSVLLSFAQEVRSGKAAEKLRAMVHTTATVLRQEASPAASAAVGTDARRNAQTRAPAQVEIPLAQVVPGDVVTLSAGDMIPADLRLLDAKDLFVNEAALTGESLPVEKFAHATAPGTQAPAAAALDLPNVCFMGSNVVSGSARGVVLATGGATYFGAIAGTLVRARVPTAFDQGINRFIWLVLRFMLVMVPLVFMVNGLTKGDWLVAFLFAVSVAVGLAPEMLPMIVTINLAKGALAMARARLIVKRLNSIQNFGAMDVLCTDKTGTLTQDRVILQKHVDIDGRDSDRVLQYGYLNSHHQSGLKNLLDVAVLEHVPEPAARQLRSRYAKVDEVPFDFQRRRMSVVVACEPEHHILICKGAVEEVFSVCTAVERGGVPVPLDPAEIVGLQRGVRALNEDGFRVLAVAASTRPAQHAPYGRADERDLTLLGYVAFLDPPKESAAAALRALHARGVQVKVLTGDNEVVARKVCRDVGLDLGPEPARDARRETAPDAGPSAAGSAEPAAARDRGRVMLGAEVDALDDAALAARVADTVLFAKLAPEQKARVIAALHARGHVVGFLGDGINDGPALRAADVGISVDTAVDIAKESADIILLEKDLRVLEAGVAEGRRVFGNILKYIRMGASSNFGNMLSVLGASAFLPFLPMAPVQVLLNNLLYDLSQTAAATDRVDASFVRAPRRWDIGSIGRFMLFLGPVSSLFDYLTFFVLIRFFGGWTDERLFQTGWFVESLLSQTLVVHVLRTAGLPFVDSAPSWPLAFATVAICATGLWLPYSPFAAELGFVPLPGAFLAALAGLLIVYLGLVQGVKTYVIRRYGQS
jgi:Mg2+-importing ATPase